MDPIDMFRKWQERVPPAPLPPLVTKPELRPLQKLQNFVTGTYIDGGSIRVTPANHHWLAPQPIGAVDPGVYGLRHDWAGITYGSAIQSVGDTKSDYLRALDQFFNRIDNRNPREIIRSFPDAVKPLEDAAGNATARAVIQIQQFAEAAARIVETVNEQLGDPGYHLQLKATQAYESFTEFIRQGDAVLAGQYDATYGQEQLQRTRDLIRLALPQPDLTPTESNPRTDAANSIVAALNGTGQPYDESVAAETAAMLATVDAVAGIIRKFPMRGQGCMR